MKKTISIFMLLSLFLVSCNNSKNTEKLIIASVQGDCVGVAPMKCLLVKNSKNGDWELFYNNIEGFTYESGYEYEIEVKKEKVKHPAADQSSLKYTLVKQISKTKKNSDHLPVWQ